MTVVVQDKENKKITEYKDVLNFKIDTNYMYLLFSETKATTIFRRYMKLVEIKED